MNKEFYVVNMASTKKGEFINEEFGLPSLEAARHFEEWNATGPTRILEVWSSSYEVINVDDWYIDLAEEGCVPAQEFLLHVGFEATWMDEEAA